MNNELSTFVDAVEQSRIDIAPTYAEYVLLAFSLATDFGEGGRSAFHRLCRLSVKYEAAHANRLYDAALSGNNRGQVHFASAVWLAQQHGVALPTLQAEPPGTEKCKNAKIAVTLTPTQARVPYHANPSPAEGEEADEGQGGGDVPFSDESEPYQPLPCFPAENEWPRMLTELLKLAPTQSQRDVLLLGMLNALGCTLAPYVRSLYAGHWVRPIMQTFVAAPPASGKSVLAWCRYFVEPLHERIRRQVEQAMAQYRKDRMMYDLMGRDRAKVDEPRPPLNRLFLIPGDNSSTGITQNIIDSGGNGIIIETEADTVTAAIGADYGKWSHLLRRLFDQDRISYNRRINQEYREVSQTLVGVLLSGTPAQVPPLIPSAENGLFSRQLFYYMPGLNQWNSQFGEQTDVRAFMRSRGEEWMKTLDDLARRGCITFGLTSGQQQRFDRLFIRLMARAKASCGNEMHSSLARLAINLLRMAMVVALLRHLERRGMDFDVAPGVPRENIQDGTVGAFTLSIDEADFQAVLSLAHPLYQHATHVLSFLKRSSVPNRNLSDHDRLLAAMPSCFDRQLWLDTAQEMSIPVNTALSWLSRLIRRHILRRGDIRGTYLIIASFSSEDGL